MIVGELQTRQIVSLVRDGMSAEQVAQALELEVAVVKIVMDRHGQCGERDITDEDLSALRAHAVMLALNAQDESVQARMTQFLIERDKPRQSSPGSNPIVLINQALLNMTQNYDKLVEDFKS